MALNNVHALPPVNERCGESASRAGVCLPVGRAESIHRNVGVDLRGGERGVAEELLHAPEVGPALQQMCSSGVPETVWSLMR